MAKLIRKPKKQVSQGFMNIAAIVIAVIGIIGFVLSQNNLVLNTQYIYENSKIPKTFVGYTVVQVSDIMNDTKSLYNKIIKQNPDLVIITGNLSSEDGKYNNSINMIKKLSSKTSVAYNLGEFDQSVANSINAELSGTAACLIDASYEIPAKNVDYNEFTKKYIGNRYIKQALEDENSKAAEYLNYTKSKLAEDTNKKIIISGLGRVSEDEDVSNKVYSIIPLDKDLFQIMAVNQPEILSDLSITDVDLILTGGSFGKDFKNSDIQNGIVNMNSSTIINSRGIGNIKQLGHRFMNYPQIITITLSDGTIVQENPLEKLLSNFIGDVSTKFDNDGGFKVHTTRYGNY